MSSGPTRLISHVQQGVTIVNFADTRVIDQRVISQIGAELMNMVEQGGVRKMLINMGDVRQVSSAVLGKLISLNNALAPEKGVLKLCNIAPSVYEVFEITRLNTVMNIYDSEVQALNAFRTGD